MKTPDSSPAEILEIACRRAEWMDADLAKAGRLAKSALTDIEQGHYGMAQTSLNLLKCRAEDLSRQVDILLGHLAALPAQVEGGHDD